jgi:hypothetical protein
VRISDARPALVLLGTRLVCAPSGGLAGLRCVARTPTGARCANPVEHGPVAARITLTWTGGFITVEDLSGAPEPLISRWLAQHCPTHGIPRAGRDAAAPEWETFQPDSIHAGLIRPSAATARSHDP